MPSVVLGHAAIAALQREGARHPARWSSAPAINYGDVVP